ncbi:choice-of-anchor C family protein [Planctomycetales bacterium ZRK34]|nr:choice-of-anchor C family protein [Planctomycetales bacterium ZRK34]
MRCKLLSAVVVAMISSTSMAAVITNGDFELLDLNGSTSQFSTGNTTGIPGWTVVSGTVDLVGSYWPGASGDQSIDLNGTSPGALSQTFDTVAGQAYRVTFAMACNVYSAVYGDYSMLVSAAGVQENFTFTRTAANTTTNVGWLYKTFDFTAAVGTTQTTLTFASLTSGNAGPAIDDVSIAEINAVPEPATFGVFGLGSMTLLAARRRRA